MSQTNRNVFLAPVIVITVIGVLFGYQILTNTDRLPIPVSPTNIGIPVRITIKSIGVHANIEAVGLAIDGSMDAPKNPLETGWYAFGPRPGETGSAVIAGHLNWLHGAAAVFADLHTVKPGDIIGTEDNNGTTISFIVRESRVYGSAANATDVFRSTDGKAHLNLITCQGVWNKALKSYSQRIVVFADKK